MYVCYTSFRNDVLSANEGLCAGYVSIFIYFPPRGYDWSVRMSVASNLLWRGQMRTESHVGLISTWDWLAGRFWAFGVVQGWDLMIGGWLLEGIAVNVVVCLALGGG
jgi:hypothetical protein